MLSSPTAEVEVPDIACSVALPSASAAATASVRVEEFNEFCAWEELKELCAFEEFDELCPFEEFTEVCAFEEFDALCAFEEFNELSAVAGTNADLLREACKSEIPRPIRGRKQVAPLHSEMEEEAATAAKNGMKARTMA